MVGHRLDAIGLCGYVRLTLADREPPSPLSPGDGTPRCVYRIPIESSFYVVNADCETLVCFQPCTDAPPTGLNELAELFLATLDEAKGVEYRSLTLTLTTQYAQ